jgi:hypothetical protein
MTLKGDTGNNSNFELLPLPEAISETLLQTSEFGQEILESQSVTLLGEEVRIGWPPNWETKETGTYHKGKSTKIPYFGTGVSGDIKLIWELHRLQWLPPVSSHAREANDLELSNQIFDALLDYATQHRYGRTVAWMEGIEVSIRAISVLMTMGTLGTADNPGMAKKLGYWMSLHGEWLHSHLSRKWRMNNNHLLLELIGLTIIGIQMPNHPESEKWRNRGISFLLSELEKQTIDGRNWEPTTAYHRFVTESCLVLHCFVSGCDSISNEDKGKLEGIIQQLVTTLIQISDQNGRIPLVGDDDGATVLPLNRIYDPRDSKPTIELADLLGFQILKETSGRRIWEGHGTGVIWDERTLIHVVSGAPGGMARQASHRHLDMLSLTVNFDGEDVLIDAGTGLYFGKEAWRNWFRGENAHSGIFSDNISWGAIRGPFEILRPALGTIELSDDAIKSYCLNPRDGNPTRTVKLSNNQVEISDFLDLPGPVVNFVLPHEAEISKDHNSVSISGPGFVLEHSPIPDSIRILEEFSTPSDDSEPNDSTAIASNGYGTYHRCRIVQLSHGRGARTLTRISPTKVS